MHLRRVDKRKRYNYLSDDYFDGLIEKLIKWEERKRIYFHEKKYPYMMVVRIEKWNKPRLTKLLQSNNFRFKTKRDGSIVVYLENGLKVLLHKRHYCHNGIGCNITGKPHSVAFFWSYVDFNHFFDYYTQKKKETK